MKILFITQIVVGFIIGIISLITNIAFFAFIGSTFLMLGAIQLRELINLNK